MSIQMIHASKRYGDFYAVKDLSMEFQDKKITILIGPSGCGKTTSMKMINALIPKDEGEIIIGGVSIDDWDPIDLRRHIGYVIQDIGLFPHYSIYDNIATVPRLLKWDEKRISTRYEELMELVNMDPGLYRDKYPAQLSGGQQQRIGVARGLASDPDIVLMDEPFGAIDPINREKIQDSFLEIQQSIQKTIVFVTHDIHEAIKLGDQIAILDSGELVQYDSAFNVVNNPASSMVEDILGADRAFKGLELLRAQDHMVTPSVLLSSIDTVGSAGKELIRLDKKYGFVIDSRKKFIGYIKRGDEKRLDSSAPLHKHCRTCETIGLQSTLLEAMTKLFSSSLHALPVVDEKQRVAGVITMKRLLEKIEEMAVLDNGGEV